MIRIVSLLCLLGLPSFAETLVAARTIPAMTILAPEDLILKEGDSVGGETDPLLFVGMETRVALYAGRQVNVGDVGFPAVVERNQIIPLIFVRNGLRISTEGRSLARAGPGEIIRVMNLTSRSTVSAKIGVDGVAYASQ
jgi:flagella basal body P-ring formation protein FlgA